jgi:hypothetical protein
MDGVYEYDLFDVYNVISVANERNAENMFT